MARVFFGTSQSIAKQSQTKPKIPFDTPVKLLYQTFSNTISVSGLEKKLEFQLALWTCSSQILLALVKSLVSCSFHELVGSQLVWALAHWASENEK